MTHKNKHETHEGLQDNGQGILGLTINPYERLLSEEYPPIPLTDAAIASEEAFIKSGQGEVDNPIIKSRDYIEIEENKYPNIDDVDVVVEDGEVVAIVDRDGIEVQIGNVAVGFDATENLPENR
jgi:hypothetical protein